MRMVVVGTSGSGKSTLARSLAKRFGLKHVELDAINWQPGWIDLNGHDLPRFRRETSAAVAGDQWVVAGNYSSVRDLVWPRATDLIWLDYSRSVVMRRVLCRSIERSLSGEEIWAGTGNREDWRRWLEPEHPIRWAWSTYARRREELGALIVGPGAAHLRIHRLRRPAEVDSLADELAAVAGRQARS